MELEKKLYIRHELLKWYRINKRDLPWRSFTEPYIIWLSEIILQQTRIEQGLPYYHRFISRFPNVRSLAEATEDEVLRLWQGLGYYSRARNLHYTAKYINEELNGAFPKDFKELKQLKGVGDYTASLIASVCFGEPEAVVDGNVFRVLSRLFGIDTPINISSAKKEFKALANGIIDPEEPGDFNQALMDFGSMVCKPSNPVCDNCIVKTVCVAYNTGTQDKFPKKNPKRRVQDRYFHYLLIRINDNILIRKRTGKDIWKNLYELPMIETMEDQPPIFSEIIDTLGLQVNHINRISKTAHILTHQKLWLHFYQATIKNTDQKGYLTIESRKLNNYAYPKPLVTFLEKIFPDYSTNLISEKSE